MCPGFKQRIEEIVYGGELEEEEVIENNKPKKEPKRP